MRPSSPCSESDKSRDVFAFASAADNVGVRDAHLAAIPAGVEGRDALFDALVAALQLPSYFGRNWDAVEECLSDLYWLRTPRVVLFHAALPILSEDDLTTYLDILHGAVRRQREELQWELVVVFPPSDWRRIDELLTDESEQE